MTEQSDIVARLRDFNRANRGKPMDQVMQGFCDLLGEALGYVADRIAQPQASSQRFNVGNDRQPSGVEFGLGVSLNAQERLTYQRPFTADEIGRINMEQPNQAPLIDPDIWLQRTGKRLDSPLDTTPHPK